MRKTLAMMAALLATPLAAQDIPGTNFSFGLWNGAAQADATGAFSHCYATLVFGGGDQLWVNVSKLDQVEVIFSFVNQTYAPGTEFDAHIMMESGLPTAGTAFALGEKLVNFNLAPVEDAHAFLSQGNWLRLMGVGNDEAYDVRGLGGVIGKLRTCREAQRAG
jgi:hypothetical protein